MFDCDAVLSGAALFSVVAVLSVLAAVSGGLTYVTSGPPTPVRSGPLRAEWANPDGVLQRIVQSHRDRDDEIACQLDGVGEVQRIPPASADQG